MVPAIQSLSSVYSEKYSKERWPGAKRESPTSLLPILLNINQVFALGKLTFQLTIGLPWKPDIYNVVILYLAPGAAAVRGR